MKQCQTQQQLNFPIDEKKIGANSTQEETENMLITESFSDESDEFFDGTFDLPKPNILAENLKIMLIETLKPQITYIIKIQSYIRMRKQNQKYKVMKKMAKQRKGCLFYDLLKTEENFVQILEMINKNLISVVEQKNLLSEQDQSDYFQNWKQIHRLNKQLLNDLQCKNTNFYLEQFVNYHPNICISVVFKKYICFFKIYYDYLAGYNADQKLEIRLRNQEFDELIIKLENSPDFNNQLIESFLIQPSQRLPRYELILKDLVKNTPEDHQDYLNLKCCLNEVKNIIGDIDQQMLSNQYKQMLFELQRMVFDPIKMVILETTRRLITAETVTVKIFGQEKLGIIYICNDIIFLTIRIKGQERFFVSIKLKKETKYLSQSLIFLFNDSKKQLKFRCFDNEQFIKLQKIFLIIYNELKNVKQTINFDNQIYVQVFGFARKSELMKKYTEFHLNIKYQQQNFTCKTRHRVLYQIEELIRKKIPGIVYNLFGEQKQIIDNLNNFEWRQRKILVEQFLIKILNCEELKKYQDKTFLKLLGLPITFYGDPNFDEQGDKIKEPKIPISFFQFQQKNIQLKGAYTYDSQFFNQRSFDPKEQLINAQIFYMDRSLKWTCEIKMTLKELRQEVAKTIELQNDSDFLIYLICQKKEIFLKNLSLAEVQLLKNSMKNRIQKVFSSNNKPLKLIFRKSFFLNSKQERQEYFQDYARLSLLCHQIFRDFKNRFYITESPNISSQIIPYYFAIKYFDIFLLNTDGKIMTEFQQFVSGKIKFIRRKQYEEDTKKSINEIIPDETFMEKTYGEWILFLNFEIKRIANETSFQMLILKFGKIDIKTKITYLVMLNFLSTQNQDRLFGSTIYDIECSKETKKLFQTTFGKSVEQSNKIALKYDRFYILTKCQVLVEVLLEEIVDIDFVKNKFIFSIGKKPGKFVIKMIKIEKIEQFRYHLEKYKEILQQKVE